MRGPKDRLIDVGYWACWRLTCRLPEPWMDWVFRFTADIAWRREGPRVQVLEANLVRVLGSDVDGKTLRAASRQVMRHYARYWLEIFRLPVMPMDRLINGLLDPADQVKMIFDILAAGRGVVIALPHMGNWDQAGAWFIARGAGSFATVMERLKPESVYERFVTFREGLGMEVLPASGGTRPFGILAQRLRAAKCVALPCDRDVTGSGIEVEFFGEKAKMMAGPAALAVQTGAALVPVVLWFAADGRCGVKIGAEIEQPATGTRPQKVAAMMQDVAGFFEQGIREHPYDWLMLQRVFVADLDPQRQAAARERAAAGGRLAGTGLDATEDDVTAP
jgi:phosphatidylinositol dimannoside acyltransferase